MDISLSDPAAQKALDLLRRSPHTFWTAAAAAAALDLHLLDAEEALEALERAGVVEKARGTTAFRYAGN